MRRTVLIAPAAVSLALVPLPAAQAEPADSAGIRGSEVLAELTQRQAEGSIAGVASGSRAPGWSLGARGSRAHRVARKAIARGPLADGGHPSRVMPAEPYLPQAGCYPKELPGVAAFRSMLLRTFPRPAVSLRSYNVVRGCNTPGISEHEEGRALDFEAHTNDRRQNAQARRLLRWLTKRSGYHARRLGIDYVIYDQHIWGQYRQRWRLMEDRGNITDNHQDHIHFTFTWNGALRRTAYWTGDSPAVNHGPCPVYRLHYAPVLVKYLRTHANPDPCGPGERIPATWRYGNSVMYWQAGRRVRWLQRYLAEAGHYTGAVTSAFGPVTYGAVRRWQKAHGVPRTGVWDPASQHASGRVVGRRVATRIDGWDAPPATGTVGQAIAIPVTVHTGPDLMSRSVAVMRRKPGGVGRVLTTARTTANGEFVARLPVLAGDWRYRLVVKPTTLAKGARTFAKAVVGTG